MTLRVSPAEIVEQSTASLLQIAEHWERVPLGWVADITNGAAFKSAQFNTSGQGLPLIRIRDVGREYSTTFYDGDYEPQHVVAPGDLLVGMDGDFKVGRWHGQTALLNQRVCRVSVADTTRFNERFLEFVLGPYLDAVHQWTSAVTVKHLSSRTIAELPIPLPPIREQQRIVAAIEEHFSRLDAAEASLSSVARRTHALVTTSVSLAFEAFDERIPLGDVASVSGGIQKQPRRRPTKNKYPFLRVANVKRSRLELDDVHEIELFGDEINSYRLEEGDLLVVEGNGSPEQVGRSAVWKGEIDDCVHQNHLIRVRPGPALDPEFLNLFWNSSANTRRLASVASSTSGLYTLSTAKLKRVEVPLASRSDQRRVTKDLNDVLEHAERIRAELATAEGRSLTLRRSILAAAFSGRLVPQDPNDEPASVLLKRIASERSTPKTHRTKKAGS